MEGEPVKRKIIITVIIAIIVAMALLLVSIVRSHLEDQRVQREIENEMEQEISMEEKTVNAYRRLNLALMGRGSDSYLPMSGISEYSGINWHTYLRLRAYENITGIYLSYEKVVDYLSEEFEPDGTLRLYNNGKHPEIEAFVVWLLDVREICGRRELTEFLDRIRAIHVEYLVAYRDEHQREWIELGFRSLSDLSPEMLSALARKEADPDYELDLINLQKQGYGVFVENPHWEMD